MKRATWLAWALWVIWPFAVIASSSSFTREAMLKSMAQNCIVPGTIELAAKADDLRRAADKLEKKPTAHTLSETENAWTKLFLACKRNEVLTFGPVEDEIFWRANFYEMVHPGLMEYTVNGAQPLDQKALDTLGSTAKGFWAAHYILFSPRTLQLNKARLDSSAETNSFDSWLLQGKTSARRRQYLCAVAADLALHLQAAAHKAQDTNFTAKFATGGQDSVNILVNQIVATLEGNLTAPLRFSLNPVLAKRAGLGAEKLAGMKASLEGLHRYYEGADKIGVNDYLRKINPNLDQRIEAQFKTAATALAGIKNPIEVMEPAKRPPVEKALAEVHKLEVMMKVDLVSTMGVTIMFHAYDGD